MCKIICSQETPQWGHSCTYRWIKVIPVKAGINLYVANSLQILVPGSVMSLSVVLGTFHPPWIKPCAFWMWMKMTCASEGLLFSGLGECHLPSFRRGSCCQLPNLINKRKPNFHKLNLPLSHGLLQCIKWTAYFVSQDSPFITRHTAWLFPLCCTGNGE